MRGDEDQASGEESKDKSAGQDGYETGFLDEQQQRKKPVRDHLTVSVPLVELLMISRQQGAYNAKCFMSMAL